MSPKKINKGKAMRSIHSKDKIGKLVEQLLSESKK